MSGKNIESLQETVRRGDRWIWGIYITLCLISIIESYSALSQVVGKQGIIVPLVRHCMFLGSGLLLLWILQRLPYNKYIPGIKIAGALILATVIIAPYVGEDINGASRALPIHLGPLSFTIQPAELAKIAVTSAVALTVSRYQIANGVTNTGTWISVTIVCVFAVFLIRQGFTNTMLIMATSCAVMLVGGIKLPRLLMVFAIYGIVGFSIYKINSYNDAKEREAMLIEAQARGDQETVNKLIEAKDDDKKGRDATWLARVERWKANIDSLVYFPISEKNRQEMIAHIAQAHGGLIGVGPGNSRECSRLPLAYSDYIYSIIIEESGLFGGIIMILLYLGLLIRAKQIAGRCARALPALLIMGMAMMITLQAFVHIAINAGFFPVSGQSLPLISEGGTSVWVVSAAFGIMLSVSRHASQNTLSKLERQQAGGDASLTAEEQAPNPLQINNDNEQ